MSFECTENQKSTQSFQKSNEFLSQCRLDYHPLFGKMNLLSCPIFFGRKFEPERVAEIERILNVDTRFDYEA